MLIEPSNWSKLHGAATHFPIALMLVSAFCDAAVFAVRDAEWRRGLRSTAGVTIILGALGSYAAVFSGLVMARWQVWGHATLLWHHVFVWPGFALMTGLATWRIATRGRAPTAIYLVLMALAAALMSGAGYWGGELLNGG
jgi:uncharacterized membrane protein